MVSIAKMRESELDMTTTPGKLKLTFGELFEKRLKSIPGKKTTIQVTVHAEVRYSYGITSELESKSWKINEPIRIPKLSSGDMYKLFIYLLLKQGFTILSTQTIEEVGADIITHKKSFFKKHKMGRFKLESYFLDKKKRFKVRTSETCVIDCIWSQVRGKPGFKTYDYDKLYEELVDYAEMAPYMDTDEIIDWIKIVTVIFPYMLIPVLIDNLYPIFLTLLILYFVLWSKIITLIRSPILIKKILLCVEINKELKIYSNICRK